MLGQQHLQSARPRHRRPARRQRGAVDRRPDRHRCRREAQISAGWYQACARGTDYTVRCWGRNEYGQLGQGTIVNIGDDGLPASAGPVMFMP
ncbi:MAG: hypothetical protein IPG88_13125 [Gemmatimonadetes bacterium]|nr:hypothetical protein [Gemmatimonadota bacterium]